MLEAYMHLLCCIAYLSFVPNAAGSRVPFRDDELAAEIGAAIINDTEKPAVDIDNDQSAGLPLWPELVELAGQTSTFTTRESVNESKRYQWMKDNTTVAMLAGTWASHAFGHQTLRVRDPSGQERFMISNANNVWNPFSKSVSFRVHPPGNKEAVMYTIKKDLVGNSSLSEQWRVFSGRARQGRLVYHCIGSYRNWDYKCYNNDTREAPRLPEDETSSDYDVGDQPIAYTQRAVERNATQAPAALVAIGREILGDSSQVLPENYRLTVREGADSALILALMTVIETTSCHGFYDCHQ